jgi:hypothetical protein
MNPCKEKTVNKKPVTPLKQHLLNMLVSGMTYEAQQAMTNKQERTWRMARGMTLAMASERVHNRIFTTEQS